MIRRRLASLVFVASVVGCAEPEVVYPEPREPLPDPQMPADAQANARLVHETVPFELEGSQETMSCYSWTVGNDAPLYVQAVEFQNGGSFHHSNWFVVPEDVYPGDDGFWPCHHRGFDDISAALAGTALFAQSTQALQETMRFTDGATIRIPARSKIVAGVHLLNLGPDPRATEAWMSLEVIHPALVETTLSPVLLSNLDLQIPANSKATFYSFCGSASLPEKPAFDLHYILPHYHRTGDAARVTLFDSDGEVEVFEHLGFGASSMGRTFDPPVSIESLSGIEFSCAYDNPHDEPLTWGIGINEMCVFLAFADTDVVIVAGVDRGSSSGPFEVDDGTYVSDGLCRAFMTPRSLAYAMPTREEIAGPLRLPASDASAPEPPTCEDALVEAVEPAPSFSDVQERVFSPWCSFSSCHGASGAGGLSFEGPQAEASLVGVGATAVDMPRVAPGDPEGSYLYRLLSECTPEVGGAPRRHMPAGAPTLLDPELVALVRGWIEGLPP
ncbi:MAG: hypothetical protein ACE37F_19240 [Nannocystaceae bacterium]|nr:hypothetical protein [bacterium]